MASSISFNAGRILLSNNTPASDNDTLRVVRLNSRTPKRRSRVATRWLRAEGDKRNAAAALRKLPADATAAIACNSNRLVGFIVLYLAANHAKLRPLLHGFNSYKLPAGNFAEMCGTL